MNFPKDDCSDDSTGCDLSQHGRWSITIVYPGGEDLCANSNICRGTFELEIIYICRYPAATLRADATLSSLYTTANTEYDWPQKKEEPPPHESSPQEAPQEEEGEEEALKTLPQAVAEPPPSPQIPIAAHSTARSSWAFKSARQTTPGQQFPTSRAGSSSRKLEIFKIPFPQLR